MKFMSMFPLINPFRVSSEYSALKSKPDQLSEPPSKPENSESTWTYRDIFERAAFLALESPLLPLISGIVIVLLFKRLTR